MFTTCLDDIYNHLEDLHLIPRNRRSQFYFTADGQQVTSGSTLHSLGIGPLSHLSLRIRILGGADEGGEGSASRSKRKRDTTHMSEIIQAEDLDSDGNPEADRPTKKKVKPRAAEGDNTDPEDKDFTSGATSDSDSEASITMTNEEIANSLTPPRLRTLPPRRKAPSKKDKGKNRASSRCTNGHNTVLEQRRLFEQRGVLEYGGGPRAMQHPRINRSNNRSPIYLFYEDVECDSDGEKEDGSRYWKCRHGKRRIFTITKSMRDNTKGKLRYRLHGVVMTVVQVSSSTSKSILYTSTVSTRYSMHENGSATAEEKAWAAGTTPMDEATKAKYANKIEELNKDIQQMFAKQARPLRRNLGIKITLRILSQNG
ncbi:hypothetical protein R3P38DRAFT_3210432 [Favolaschia claudopus]|uniref:Ubiquitin-like domain-containing protein n=1 Tax=Favolaschia claudopus TaxID=2862362 RepID=A0AAW0AHD4_9AGAR